MGYMSKLENGSITLEKTPEGVRVLSKRFDPETGEELDPTVETWSEPAHIQSAIEPLQQSIENQQDNLDFYQEILSKFDEA